MPTYSWLRASLLVAVLAVSGCKMLSGRSSACPTSPPVQTVPVTRVLPSRSPCLTQPPPQPPPELEALATDPPSLNGEPRPLTIEEQTALEDYAAALAIYSARAWHLCEQSTGTTAP